MQMFCEVCGSALRAEDVRLDLAVAKCGACNAVYDLSGRKGRAVAPPPAELKPVIRPKAALPPRFQVEEERSATRITWRWFNPVIHIFMAFFCVLWDGFLIVWYGLALGRGAAGDEVPLVAVLFPLGHVAAGVFITYITLAGFLNRTRVEVSRDRLTIHHGPLRWPGNKDLPGRQFTQLFGEEVIRRGKNGVTVTYDLIAVNREGTRVKLLTGLTEREQVLYLEQTLERQLGIEDAPVEGEVATRTRSA